MLIYGIYMALAVVFGYCVSTHLDNQKQNQANEHVCGLVAVEMVRNEFPAIPELDILDNPVITESPPIFSSFHKVLNSPCSVRTAKEGEKSTGFKGYDTSEQEKLFKALQSEFTDTPLIEPWKNLLKVSRNSSRSSDYEACEPTDISRAYTIKYATIQKEAQGSPTEKLKQKIDALKKQRTGNSFNS